MNPADEQPTRLSSLTRLYRATLALAVATTALGFSSTSASAAGYETVKHFAPIEIPTVPPEKDEEFPEDTQMGGVSGMAVNRTGAGVGVKAGTVYAAGFEKGNWHVARFSPEGEFELSWTSLKRCGPKTVEGACPPAPTALASGLDVDIDQATGNVYVYAASNPGKLIRVYNPDGSTLIAEFGELDFDGTIAATPTKIHRSPFPGAIAVDETGKVYVFDRDKEGKHRLAIFKSKTPGDFSEYEYAGEILNGSGTDEPLMPVLDDAGHIYTTAAEEFVEEHSSTGAKLCEFNFKKGGITSITVNPVSEEPFFNTYKDAKIHRLAACNAGKFAEEEAVPPFRPEPQRGSIEAMTFNPELEWEPGRPAGTLYAGAAVQCPPLGSCAAQQGQSAQGYILAQAASHIAPVVEEESVSGVGTTSATLETSINPKGSQTSFKFEYMTEAAYEEAGETFSGATEAPLGGAPLGVGQKPLQASTSVSGLVPDTAYRYRAIATSAGGSDEGEAASFRTFAIATGGLPDARAWEPVSPAQKNGGEVLPSEPNLASCGGDCKPGTAAKRFPAIATAKGDAVAYQGSPFTLNVGPSEYDQYVSRRESGGWQTIGLSPPLAGDSQAKGFQSFGLNASLSKAVVYAKNPALAPQAPPGLDNLMLEDVGDPLALDPFVVAPDPEHRTTSANNSWTISYAGASADFSRQFFAANDALATAVPPVAVDGGAEKFNLYERTGGQLRIVNVLPNGETVPGAVFGSGKALDSSSAPVEDLAGAISLDGSRVFWSDESGQLYVRIGGSETLEVPGSGPSARFLAASADGSRVLLSNGQLLELDEEVGTYEPAFDLSEGLGGFKGLVGHSDDFSHIYFVDTEVLDATPNEFGDSAQAGKPNLYFWQGGADAYVGTLLPGDNEELGTWKAPPARRSGEASPDGRFLAFGSKAELTDVNSVGVCKFDLTKLKFVSAAPCNEVYLYDSATGELVCPSCNPVGAPPLGHSSLRLQWLVQGYLPQPRFLTNAGRLYFDSRDSLVGTDTNNGVEDVYQYEPHEVGGCEEQDGCVDLISSGRGGYDANLVTIDKTGDNVFFTTRERLVPSDQDSLIDLYDARVEGGFPEEASAPAVPCQGESCLPAARVPANPTPASSSFSGAGNVKAGGNPNPRCPKGKRRANRAGKQRCVPRRSKVKQAKEQRRAGHNRGGAK